jgi:flagellar basal body-associated protein FliL
VDKKTKLIIGGVVIGILAIVVIYLKFFSGEKIDRTAADANAAAAAASEAATAKAPPPPPPEFKPKPGTRNPKVP